MAANDALGEPDPEKIAGYLVQAGKLAPISGGNDAAALLMEAASGLFFKILHIEGRDNYGVAVDAINYLKNAAERGHPQALEFANFLRMNAQQASKDFGIPISLIHQEFGKIEPECSSLQNDLMILTRELQRCDPFVSFTLCQNIGRNAESVINRMERLNCPIQ